MVFHACLKCPDYDVTCSGTIVRAWCPKKRLGYDNRKQKVIYYPHGNVE